MDNLEKGSEQELHVRAHTALELEHDVNLPCESWTVAARAKAEEFNYTFGDQQIKVKRLDRRVVEDLCKLRNIYEVTTEEELRM